MDCCSFRKKYSNTKTVCDEKNHTIEILCAICFKNIPDCAILPCGHMKCCYDCTVGTISKYGRCPYCNIETNKYIKIYR